MRERDRRTYTMIWVAVTVVAAGILVVVGSLWFAVALVAVAAVGLIAFLRATHPRGQRKPNLNIFFDDLDVTADAGGDVPVEGATEAPAPPVAPVARRTEVKVDRQVEAEVIRLRPAAAGEGGGDGPTLDEAVAASSAASAAVNGGDDRPSSPEVAEELSAHHVRLLRKVQVKLQDYE